MTEFAGIAPAIAEALAKRGYETLTPVQQAMLDPSLGTADALVSAQTGSGKTVAFGLALAPTLIGSARKFAQAGAPLALVIAPTRELALQVMRELDWLYEMAGPPSPPASAAWTCAANGARWNAAPISSSGRRDGFATISAVDRSIYRD